MFLLYNFLTTLLAPLWVPWMLLRSRRRAETVNWAERQGDHDVPVRPEARRIWVHAVSVGEVVAAVPILRAIRQRLPEYEIVLSVTTSSGHQTARDQPPGLYDYLIYSPIDVPRFTLASMSRVRPAVLAIMETELWLNFMWAAKEFDAGTLLINGRISPRSFRRYRWIGGLVRDILRRFDACLMQTEGDAERVRALGAPHVEVLGNSKFDQAAQPPTKSPEAWRDELGIPADAPVLVIGSTRSEMEERLVVEAVAALQRPDLYVIHAPRHLERAAALGETVAAAFGAVAFRSKGETGRYLVLDTYGELGEVYAIATVTVIGGGFDALGGQNLLQPLAWGKPVVHGPHMTNFKDVADAAHALGLTRVATNAATLAEATRQWLDDEPGRQRIHQAATEFIERNRGASERYAEAIAQAAEAAMTRRASRKPASR